MINGTQIFESDECVICLTNPPNILFCNCGHLCLCEECDKVKSLSVCPICKTENTIKIFFLLTQGKYFINVSTLGYAPYPPVYTFYHH